MYRRCRVSELLAEDIALLGVPWDVGSSFLRGPADAPAKIRQVLGNGASNSCSELGVDTAAFVRDVGDVEALHGLADGERGWQAISDAVRGVLAQKARLIALGGDHAVTFPIVRAVAEVYGPLDIVHLDAHPDLYPDFDGKPWSHASPFARIAETGLFSRLVQIGIRTLNAVQRAEVERYKVELIEMRSYSRARISELRFERPVYLSIDLDGLDPAFAPGVSHPEPGGLSTRDVLHVIHELAARVVAADIVELNPRRDVGDSTAVVAAKFVKEIAGGMVGRGGVV